MWAFSGARMFVLNVCFGRDLEYALMFGAKTLNVFCVDLEFVVFAYSFLPLPLLFCLLSFLVLLLVLLLLLQLSNLQIFSSRLVTDLNGTFTIHNP